MRLLYFCFIYVFVIVDVFVSIVIASFAVYCSEIWGIGGTILISCKISSRFKHVVVSVHVCVLGVSVVFVIVDVLFSTVIVSFAVCCSEIRGSGGTILISCKISSCFKHVDVSVHVLFVSVLYTCVFALLICVSPTEIVSFAVY